MKCPDCTNEVISLPRFILKLYPRNLTCRFCRAELTWSDSWRQVFHRSVMMWILGALIMSLFRHMVGMSLVVYALIGIILALAFDAVFWRSAHYEKAVRT